VKIRWQHKETNKQKYKGQRWLIVNKRYNLWKEATNVGTMGVFGWRGK
jgi:hypothetical protein